MSPSTPDSAEAVKERRQRFFAKVDKTPTCWNWTGAQRGKGYGGFWDGSKNIAAHHFLLPVRPVYPEEACHTCDNRLCVNPDHIFLGTRKDNMRDCVRKGRLRPNPSRVKAKSRKWIGGTINPASVLSESTVGAIKILALHHWQKGMGPKLAEAFGVSISTISLIKLGKRWGHLIPNDTAKHLAQSFLTTKTRPNL